MHKLLLTVLFSLVTLPISANAAILADFSWHQVDVQGSVIFDGSRSIPSAEHAFIREWHWDLGDGHRVVTYGPEYLHHYPIHQGSPVIHADAGGPYTYDLRLGGALLLRGDAFVDNPPSFSEFLASLMVVDSDGRVSEPQTQIVTVEGQSEHDEIRRMDWFVRDIYVGSGLTPTLDDAFLRGLGLGDHQVDLRVETALGNVGIASTSLSVVESAASVVPAPSSLLTLVGLLGPLLAVRYRRQPKFPRRDSQR